MIDNFDIVRKHLVFDDARKYYFIQIVKRSKDNPDMKKYMQVVKSFYIFSENDYNKYTKEIKQLCQENNARAYIDFNRLDVDEVKDKAKDILDKYYSYGYKLDNKKWFKKLHYCFDDASIIIGTQKKENNYPIVDIDEKGYLDKISKSKYIKDNIIFTVPTVHGDHIIIKDFKKRKEFFEEFKDIDVSIMDYCYVLLYYNK